MFRSWFNPLLLLVVYYSSSCFAASIPGVASLTVQNSITIKQSSSLDFGILNISVSPSSFTDGNSILTLHPSGRLIASGPINTHVSRDSFPSVSPAKLSIENSVPYTDLMLNISSRTSLIHNQHKHDNSDIGQLYLDQFVAVDQNNVKHEYVSGNIVKTDNTGTLELALGATMTMLGNTEYIDGLYTGSYSIELHY